MRGVGQVISATGTTQDWISWQAKFMRAGKYRVTAQTASPNPDLAAAQNLWFPDTHWIQPV